MINGQLERMETSRSYGIMRVVSYLLNLITKKTRR